MNDTDSTPPVTEEEAQSLNLTEEQVLAAKSLEQAELMRAQNQHLLNRVVVLRAMVLNQQAEIKDLKAKNSPEEVLVEQTD